MSDEMILPVFPLPEVILFPRTMLPLHIFEPRYRELVTDMLSKPENERLIVISNMTKVDQQKGSNPFASVATVGKMIHYELLPDGRSNIVLQGQFTADIEEVIPSPKSYRICKIMKIREEYWSDPLADRQDEYSKLLESIRDFMNRTNSRIKNLDEVALDDLINGLAFSLNIESDDKQELLESQKLDERLDQLIQILNQIGFYSNYIPSEEEYSGIN